MNVTPTINGQAYNADVEPRQRLVDLLRDTCGLTGTKRGCETGEYGACTVLLNGKSAKSCIALALDALMHLAGAGGRRVLAADQFLRGAFETALKPGEIVIAVEFLAQSVGAGSAYEKFRHPASGYAICGVAAKIEPSAGRKVGRCRIAVSGATSHTVRLRHVEVALEGKSPTRDNLAAAVRQIAQVDLHFRSDLAASAEYRAHLPAVRAERALARCAAGRILDPLRKNCGSKTFNRINQSEVEVLP